MLTIVIIIYINHYVVQRYYLNIVTKGQASGIGTQDRSHSTAVCSDYSTGQKPLNSRMQQLQDSC